MRGSELEELGRLTEVWISAPAGSQRQKDAWWAVWQYYCAHFRADRQPYCGATPARPK